MLSLIRSLLVLAAWATVCNGFSCPWENGTFPALEGCRSYYKCENNKSEIVSCRGTLVYNPSSGQEKCVKRSIKNKCFVFDCYRKGGSKTEYPGDPTLCAKCENNKAVSIGRCQETSGGEIKDKEESCVLGGLMPNETNCYNYLECTREGDNLTMVERVCPPGTSFMRESKQCKDGPNPDCPNITNECTTSETTCANCTTRQYCKGNNTIVLPCPEETPYCYSGSCYEHESVCTPFKCTSDNIFPDLSLCWVYHLCYNGTAKTESCGDEAQFDSDSNMCRPEAPCDSFDCTGRVLGYVTHPIDNRYYAFCVKQIPTLAYKCPNDTVYDEGANKCSYKKCGEGDGLQPVRGNCSKYLDCEGREGREPYIGTCPTGYWFNPRTHTCQPKGNTEPPECEDKLMKMLRLSK